MLSIALMADAGKMLSFTIRVHSNFYFLRLFASLPFTDMFSCLFTKAFICSGGGCQYICRTLHQYWHYCFEIWIQQILYVLYTVIQYYCIIGIIIIFFPHSCGECSRKGNEILHGHQLRSDIVQLWYRIVVPVYIFVN